MYAYFAFFISSLQPSSFTYSIDAFSKKKWLINITFNNILYVLCDLRLSITILYNNLLNTKIHKQNKTNSISSEIRLCMDMVCMYIRHLYSMSTGYIAQKQICYVCNITLKDHILNKMFLKGHFYQQATLPLNAMIFLINTIVYEHTSFNSLVQIQQEIILNWAN